MTVRASAASRPIRTIRHKDDAGSWELARAEPAPSLKPDVRGYCGWIEHMREPLCRVEAATTTVPLIILFGAPIRDIDRHNPEHWTERRSFVAGLSDTCALVGSHGPMAGVQIDLSPVGARRLLGFPLEHIAHRLIEIDDIWGADARRLVDALAEAASWEARFALLDREIGRRMAAAPAANSVLAWALDRLDASAGAVPIHWLVRQAGWSRRHFGARFHHEFGLTPKMFARVLRFERALTQIKGTDPVRLVDIAADCGYADQSHFTRDFREFAGRTPTELRAARMPGGGGFAV